jgi:hypothetical protein
VPGGARTRPCRSKAFASPTSPRSGPGRSWGTSSPSSAPM